MRRSPRPRFAYLRREEAIPLRKLHVSALLALGVLCGCARHLTVNPKRSQTGAPAVAAGSLRIVVLEGEGVRNNLSDGLGKSPVVVVEDENHRPIPGATVVFRIAVGGGVDGTHFSEGDGPGGASWASVKTGGDGMARAPKLVLGARSGSLTIEVEAALGTMRVMTVIDETIRGPVRVITLGPQPDSPSEPFILPLRDSVGAVGAAQAKRPPARHRGKTEPLMLAMSAAPPEAPAAEPSMAQRVTAWVNGLPSGSVQYFVKDTMTLNVPLTATAKIYPPGVAPPAKPSDTEQGGAVPAAGGTVSPQQAEIPHALKVAPYMRVDLTQEDNPGTFKIDPAQGECKLVLTDRPTEWSFQVTPVEGGSGKKLTFTAYAVYGADASSCAPGNPAAIPLPVDKRTVNVAEFNVRNAWQTAWDTFWGSPWKWLLSILPGGAAFARIGTIRDWWEKRKKPVVKDKV